MDSTTIIIIIIVILVILIIVSCITCIIPYYKPKQNENKYETMETNNLVNYRPVLINKSINLYYIPNFLTSNECDHIINLAQDKFVRSGVVTNAESSYSNNRTSYTYYLQKKHDNIIANIEKRVSLFVDKPEDCIESLQIVRYQAGQEFKEHHDWFQPDYRKRINNNQRQYTFFVYLNDVDDGGLTRFPKLNVSFKPEKGTALFWQNCLTHDICLQDNLHQGEPPKNSIKYGLNIWINFDKIQ